MWATFERNIGHTGEPYTPFAYGLLHDLCTLLFICKTGNREGLIWETYSDDFLCFKNILQQLYATTNTSDTDFKTQVHPQIAHSLLATRLFRELNSSDIVVTKAHIGSTPFEHSCNVALALKTTGLSPQHILALRCASYYHDLGKSLGGNVYNYRLRELMLEYNQPRHSYPSHDLVSFEILHEFILDPKFAEIENLISPKTTRQLLLIVLNHHMFEFRNNEAEQFISNPEAIAAIAKDEGTFEAFLLTFIFFYADLTSNAEYRKYWPDKVMIFERILQLCPVTYVQKYKELITFIRTQLT